MLSEMHSQPTGEKRARREGGSRELCTPAIRLAGMRLLPSRRDGQRYAPTHSDREQGPWLCPFLSCLRSWRLPIESDDPNFVYADETEAPLHPRHGRINWDLSTGCICGNSKRD